MCRWCWMWWARCTKWRSTWMGYRRPPSGTSPASLPRGHTGRAASKVGTLVFISLQSKFARVYRYSYVVGWWLLVSQSLVCPNIMFIDWIIKCRWVRHIFKASDQICLFEHSVDYSVGRRTLNRVWNVLAHVLCYQKGTYMMCRCTRHICCAKWSIHMITDTCPPLNIAI